MEEERRADYGELKSEITKIRERVYNGLGAELRAEVTDAMGAMKTDLTSSLNNINSLVVGVLVALLLSLSGIVVSGIISAGKDRTETDRTYAAIMQLDKKLDLHLLESELTHDHKLQ